MLNAHRIRTYFAIVAVVVAMVGCGGPANEYDSVVTGTVTIDGELAKSGTVTFHPVKDGLAAIGRIHGDGSYSLRTGQGNLREVDGGTVVPGDYLVTVSVTAPPAEGAIVAEGGPPIPGPSLIARRYAQKETTDLRFTVKPGPQVIVLNLDVAEPSVEQAGADQQKPEETAIEITEIPESQEGANTDQNGEAGSADESAHQAVGDEGSVEGRPTNAPHEKLEESNRQ